MWENPCYILLKLFVTIQKMAFFLITVKILNSYLYFTKKSEYVQALYRYCEQLGSIKEKTGTQAEAYGSSDTRSVSVPPYPRFLL